MRLWSVKLTVLSLTLACVWAGTLPIPEEPVPRTEDQLAEFAWITASRNPPVRTPIRSHGCLPTAFPTGGPARPQNLRSS